MTLTGVVDDHMLSQYRVLLDREDEAFDELEHAASRHRGQRLTLHLSPPHDKTQPPRHW
ncbi:MAG: hypothetical protein ABSD85_09860 [Acidimicrobiales bacterium]